MVFSDNGGTSFSTVYTADDLYIAGVFWGDAGIFVGTRAGLLVSTDGGASFSLDPTPGLPTDQAIIGFAAAQSGGTTRLIAITGDSAYPGMSGVDLLWSYKGIYRLDWGGANWEPIATGIAASDGLSFAGVARNDIDRVYVAGSDKDYGIPVVYRSSDGGSTWTSVFVTENNGNIATGWCGDDGDEQWWWSELPMGFAVSPIDPLRAVMTDFGFVHVTDDGGQTWRQAYVHPQDQNPAGYPTPKGLTYRGIGLQQTTVWWLNWPNASTLNAAFTDIQGMRSTDGGLSWQAGSSLGLPHNTTYHIAAQPGTDDLYAATSSVHDLYGSTYLADAKIDGGEGHVVLSTDEGASWTLLHDFGHPVIWLAFDPNDPNSLYASVVHSTEGGIYATHDLQNGPAASWQRLSAPPRTQGHAFNIHVLDDSTLVATYSGHQDSSGGFTARSGVFVSTDGGASWSDRSDPGMHYWTKDLVIDPHDNSQSTWLVGVFQHWGGGHAGFGGLFRTTDRGLHWTRISDIPRVESVTIDPKDEDVAWMTTEAHGLWKSQDFSESMPSFSQDPDYPFQHPVRVFLNPYDDGQMWVASVGDGLRATGSIGQPVDCSGHDVEVPGGTVFPTGQTSCIATSRLTTGDTVTIPTGADVYFEAPMIELRPGLRIELGARFLAASP